MDHHTTTVDFALLDASSARTEELCELFTSTVSSLSADANALRQLSSLAALAGLDESQDEDHMPSKESQRLLEQLRKIEKVVSAMEQNVRVLNELVYEETTALDKMQDLQEKATTQTKALQEMLQSLKLDASVETEPSADSATPDSSLEESEEDEVMSPGGVLGIQQRPATMRRDSTDPRRVRLPDGSPPEFQHVSPAELTQVPRTLRGRIPLSVLNDALDDIECVCQYKYELLFHEKGSLTVSQEREYYKVLRIHQDLEVDALKGTFWVSEQELRQACAFFRSGESTARAILLLLRTLKRLKHVTAKQSEITYVCLPPSEHDDTSEDSSDDYGRPRH